MNSEEDLESIINCLSLLQRIAKYKSKLGLLDINIDYENFIKKILNITQEKEAALHQRKLTMGF